MAWRFYAAGASLFILTKIKKPVKAAGTASGYPAGARSAKNRTVSTPSA
jgi:hypothetical protein